MVTGRTKGMTLRVKGNVVLVAAQLDDADGNPTEQYVLLRADEFGRLRTIDAGAVPGVTTWLGLTDTPAAYGGQEARSPLVNPGEAALAFADRPSWPMVDRGEANPYVLPGYGTSSSRTTNGTVANTRYFSPIYVDRETTYTRIAIHVTTAQAGNSRLGIYEADFDVAGFMEPGALVLDAGTVDVSTIGEKAIAINEILAPGYHFLTFGSDVNPTLAAYNIAFAGWGPVTGMHTSVFNTSSTPASSAVVVDASAALPDPADTPTGGQGFAIATSIALRI